MFAANRRFRSNLPWVALTLVLLVVVSAPDTTAGRNGIMVEVGEPFLLAGELLPAGRLAVRDLVAFNPVTALVEVWIGERCLGLVRAERTADEVTLAGHSFSFERDVAGRLVLAGFTTRGQAGRAVFRFADSSPTPPAIRAGVF